MRTLCRSLTLVAGACALLASAFAADAAKPWDHGRLKVDPTGRMLIHEDGHPFFWMGDSCWEFVHRSTREEVDRYLADRAEKRFNVIQAVAVAEFGALEVPNAYGHLPFEKTPVYPSGDMGVPRVRPGENDDYWDHVSYIVDRAAAHGIYVCYVVTWATHITPATAVDEHNAQAFGSFIGRSMKDKPNVIYMLGCDRNAERDGVDYRLVWRLMAQGVREADPNHLMSFLLQYFDARHWFGEERWLDFDMIQYRGPDTSWDPLNLVSASYAKQPAMPIINVECNLDGAPHYHGGNFVGADLCRREFYWYVFSGAFGHTYGHLSLITWWNVNRPYNIWFTKPTMSWHEALDSDGAREKKFARNLMESRPLIGRTPDPSLIAYGYTEKIDHLEACRGDGYAYVYTPTAKNFVVNMGRISGDEVRAWWFDPRTGVATEIGTFPNRGSRTFDAPGEPRLGNDWILVLDDVSRNYPPPGSEDHPQTMPSAAAKREAVRAVGPAPAVNPPTPGSELVVNGGFENGATAWILNGAELAADPQAGAPGGHRPTGWSGGAALVMKQAAWKTAEQRIAAVPKTRYTVSGQLRSEACTAPVGIVAIFVDELGREVGRRLVSPAVHGTTAYRRYTVDVITPSNTRFIDVRLYSGDGGTGQVFFDEIGVVAVAESPPAPPSSIPQLRRVR